MHQSFYSSINPSGPNIILKSMKQAVNHKQKSINCIYLSFHYFMSKYGKVLFFHIDPIQSQEPSLFFVLNQLFVKYLRMSILSNCKETFNLL